MFYPGDRKVDLYDIVRLMDNYDNSGVFDTRFVWEENFMIHFLKLLNLGQIGVFREGRKITGFCSWILTTPTGFLDINKIRWVLPKVVTQGEILYIDTCLLSRPGDMWELRRFFKNKYQKVIQEVVWWKGGKGRCFRLKIKGGVTCPTAV